VLAVDHPVLAFRQVIDGGALHIVLAQTHARLDEGAVGLWPMIVIGAMSAIGRLLNPPGPGR